jgi:peptide/nickel transport system substrate-binding protein
MVRRGELRGNVVTSGNEISRRSFLSRSALAGGAVALGAGAPSLLAGCSSSAGSPTTTAAGSKPGVGTGTPKRGGTLTIGTIADIDGFYPPSNHWDTNGFLYANAVYDPLMAVAADGSIQPYLAQSMTPNSTFDTWTMTLRPNIKFNDGSALTSAVVASNFNALKKSALTGVALAQVSAVDTPDAMTVVYHLTGPNPTFPSGLTTQVGYVVGQAMIDQASGGGSGVVTPVGTGPFIYSQWQQNSFFTATRNPNYWRSGLPYLDTITFRPIPDSTQRESTLRSGGVDMIQSATPATITNFEGSGGSGFQLVDSRTGVVGQPTFTYIMLNTVTPPTNDLSIRQALAKAMNQEEVQKIIGGPPQQPATGIFLPSSPYYSKTAYPSFDPSGAASLVSQYKAKHGTPTLQLMTIPDPIAIKEVQAVQQMWQQVGFNVTINEVEQATIINDFIVGKFQAVTSYQFGAVNPDLNYVWWSTTTISPIGSIGLNFTRLDDPTLETAMLQGRHTTDQATRVQAYRTVNEQLGIQLPYLWIEQFFFSEVAAPRVQNFNNPTLPDGKPGLGFNEGIIFPTQIWLNG